MNIFTENDGIKGMLLFVAVILLVIGVRLIYFSIRRWVKKNFMADKDDGRRNNN